LKLVSKRLKNTSSNFNNHI